MDTGSCGGQRTPLGVVLQEAVQLAFYVYLYVHLL